MSTKYEEDKFSDFDLCDFPDEFHAWRNYWDQLNNGGRASFSPTNAKTIKDQYAYVINVIRMLACDCGSLKYNKCFLSLDQTYRKYDLRGDVCDKAINTIDKECLNPASAVRCEMICDFPFFWEVRTQGQPIRHSIFPCVMCVDITGMPDSLKSEGRFNFDITVYPGIFSDSCNIITSYNIITGFTYETRHWLEASRQNCKAINDYLNTVGRVTQHNMQIESSFGQFDDCVTQV